MKPVCLTALSVLAFLAGAIAPAPAATLPVGMTAVPLAIITNDRDTSVSRIELMVDDEAGVSGIYMETRASADSEPARDAGQVYWLEGIESRDGVVLGQGKGHKAILMRGDIASGKGRGSLVIRYLSNGLFGHYKQCRINLRRVAPHRWQLVNAYDGHPIKRIKVKTWALGISTLVNVCPAEA